MFSSRNALGPGVHVEVVRVDEGSVDVEQHRKGIARRTCHAARYTRLTVGQTGRWQRSVLEPVFVEPVGELASPAHSAHPGLGRVPHLARGDDEQFVADGDARVR